MVWSFQCEAFRVSMCPFPFLAFIACQNSELDTEIQLDRWMSEAVNEHVLHRRALRIFNSVSQIELLAKGGVLAESEDPSSPEVVEHGRRSRQYLLQIVDDVSASESRRASGYCSELTTRSPFALFARFLTLADRPCVFLHFLPS